MTAVLLIIPRRLLCPSAMGSIHLAEVPLYAKENIPAHTQAIGILLVVGSDCVCKSPRLVQDVITLDT